MWRILAVVVALQGCVDANKGTRWPGHRKDHDARLDKLEEQLLVDDRQLASLALRIKQLESALAHAPAAVVAPPVEAPTPPAP
jgi:hypothetical protein